MITKPQTFFEKYRAERSAKIAIVCDVSPGLISAVYYDLALHRRYARAAVSGFPYGAQVVGEVLIRLITESMREFGIPASAVRSVGIAADSYIEMALEESLSPEALFLAPDTEIFFVPFISAAIGGRFTAMLLTLPDEDCTAADLGKSLCVCAKHENHYTCAAFRLSGAFDGTGLDSGMPAENGAIDAVRRDSDGIIAYEVVGDGESAGVSPCGALMALGIMLDTGALDPDGIMTDRDLFFIGEDYFLSQSDVRAVQADKAGAAAALSLLPKADRAFFSGELFSTAAGLKALLRLGGFPDWCEKAAFCRNSSEQGIILCLEDPKLRERAYEIAKNAEDITQTLLPEFDRKYFDFLSFPRNK